MRDHSIDARQSQKQRQGSQRNCNPIDNVKGVRILDDPPSDLKGVDLFHCTWIVGRKIGVQPVHDWFGLTMHTQKQLCPWSLQISWEINNRLRVPVGYPATGFVTNDADDRDRLVAPKFSGRGLIGNEITLSDTTRYSLAVFATGITNRSVSQRRTVSRDWRKDGVSCGTSGVGVVFF